MTLGLPSNLPFSGYYFIECYEPNDATARFTNAISWDADRHAVASAIYSYNACPNLRNKFEVIKQQIWNEDELNWVLYFENVDGNLPQFKIHKVQDELAYSAYADFVGVDEQVTEAEFHPRSGNIYYEVLPFEYLYTDESQPQVIVTVDGSPALCTTLNCEYLYASVAGEVTSMTVTGTSIAITGTLLPTGSRRMLSTSTPLSVEVAG